MHNNSLSFRVFNDTYMLSNDLHLEEIRKRKNERIKNIDPIDYVFQPDSLV